MKIPPRHHNSARKLAYKSAILAQMRDKYTSVYGSKFKHTPVNIKNYFWFIYSEKYTRKFLKEKFWGYNPSGFNRLRFKAAKIKKIISAYIAEDLKTLSNDAPRF